MIKICMCCTKLNNPKIGDLYFEENIQKLVNSFNNDCTIKGLFPILTNKFNIISFTFLIAFSLSSFFCSFIYDYLKSPDQFEFNILIFFLFFISSFFIYLFFTSTLMNIVFLMKKNNENMPRSILTLLKLEKSKRKNLKKKYITDMESNFLNNEDINNPVDIGYLIYNLRDKRINITKVDYKSVIVFLVACLTYLKVETNLTIVYSFFEDLYNVSYYLAIVIIPCILAYACIYNIPIIFSKLTKSSNQYLKKEHYFKLLTFLEKELKLRICEN